MNRQLIWLLAEHSTYRLALNLVSLLVETWDFTFHSFSNFSTCFCWQLTSCRWLLIRSEFSSSMVSAADFQRPILSLFNSDTFVWLSPSTVPDFDALKTILRVLIKSNLSWLSDCIVNSMQYRFQKHSEQYYDEM